MKAWTKNKIELQAWQVIPERMAQLGLTAEDGMARVWFVDENGRLTGGAEAVNEALKHCWWAKPATYIYPIPAIKHLEEKIYRWVADNRYRMPGSTATCALPQAKEQDSTA